MRMLGVLLIGAALAGCGSGRTPDFSHACAHMDTSGAIPTCTALFDGAVGLKLPTGTAEHPYGAQSHLTDAFITSKGRAIPIKRKPLKLGAPVDTQYANTVYRATVTGGQVTSITPVLRISENAILNHTFGSKLLVGEISQRNPDGTYDLDQMIPIVIALDAKARHGALSGTIENATRSVRIPGGRCLTALAAATTNPLVDGFTNKVQLVRVPSMHVPFDDEMVLDWNESSSGMGREFYPSVATVMGHEALPGTWQVFQHGAPDSGPALKLRLVDGSLSKGNC